MENKNISQIVLERIKGEGLKPISKNIFSVKRVFFWVAVALSLIIGAFTFSLVLSSLFNNDWDLYNKFGFRFIFRTLPYFWFISLCVFVVLGEYYYRKTLYGYRHTIVVVVGVYMASSIIFGSIFYIFKISDLLERPFDDVPPQYRNMILNRHEVWGHPEEGLMSGRIMRIGDNELGVMDFDGSVWIISTENALIRKKVELELGRRIKIIGDKMDDRNFHADEIRPWMGMR